MDLGLGLGVHGSAHEVLTGLHGLFRSGSGVKATGVYLDSGCLCMLF